MFELELGPLWVSLRLGLLTVVCLLLIATPIAWWLAFTRSRARAPIEAVVALPLVLPPTVLGFYLLILLGPAGWIGRIWVEVTDTTLTFSFTGLVLASIVYSLPFAVQPLQNAFESLPRQYLERSWTLGASRLDAFFSIAVPLSIRGFVGGAVLSFAHTLGEFGVVLMVGGNIPDETRTAAIAIYDRVQVFDDRAAGAMSALLLAISFLGVWVLFLLDRRVRRPRP